MAKRKKYFLPMTSVLAMLIACLALTVLLPLPEERAFNQLLQVEIKSIRWNGITPREAVAELNAEVEKVSDTRYRFFLSESARSDIPVYLELNHVLAVECAKYLGQESGNRHYLTSDGYVIDGFGKESTYDKPSWRRFLRHWATSRVPSYWRRLRGQPTDDPFWPSQ